LRNVGVVAGKEFRGFLRSPLGYVILAVYALVSGLILVTLLFVFHEQMIRAAQQAQLIGPAGAGPNLQISVVSPYFLNVASLLLFVVPFLTMRSFAEEKHSRSLEVLISYPLRVWEIALGKFVGVFGFALLLLAITVGHLVILGLAGSAALLPLLGGMLGFILLAAALVAMGVFVSSLAAGQIEAAVLTLGFFLVLAMVGGITRPGASWVQEALANLSPLYHFQGFGHGVLSTGSVLVLLAITVLFVALSIRGTDLIKWRG